MVHAELCNCSYGNVTFVRAHDSFAFSEDLGACATIDQAIDIPSLAELLALRFGSAPSI
ncbi:hypothetical protein GGX14DRAFT_569274 [Mycena pura]|uniref:Uncharacterized protein n=1 Tax=Mycena pura TaxID=153505 RepID=A0AAD6V7C5_9AGAR|nr:hypothetical protein GGX14DRAFT_569274 [Mycena pura]